MSEAKFEIYEKFVRIYARNTSVNRISFPEVDQLPQTLPWIIDLGDLTSLNSIAIRNWILWMSQVSYIQVFFENTPDFFLNQASQVKDLIPAHGQIISVHLFYFCEENDKQLSKTFGRRLNEKFHIPRRVTVKENEKTFVYVLDATPAKTFRCIEHVCDVYDLEEDPVFFLN